MFDLDGTLLDTLADLANAMNAALAELGFPTHPVEAYRYFVGDGIDTEAKRALPNDHHDSETIKKCVGLAAQYYGKCWSENTKPYPGILELLTSLQRRKIPMTVLSNKPHDFTKLIIEKLLSAWSFRIVRGVSDSTPTKPDAAGALQIAEELKIPPQRFLYLGDTNTDMQTADSAGMYALGALWGFRTADELLANGAKALVEKPQDVLKFLNTSR